MVRRGTDDVISASSLSDLAIPTMGGILGGFLGWAGWQAGNATCLLALTVESPSARRNGTKISRTPPPSAWPLQVTA